MRIKFFLLLLLVSFSNSLLASIQDDPLQDVHWKKMTTSREDLYVFWEINQGLINGCKDYIRFLRLKDLGPFDTFYEKTIAAQKKPAKKTLYLELNPLSGVYFFYLNQQELKPLGFIKVGSELDSGIITESIAIKKDSPKGIGTKALFSLKDLINQYRGQSLMFCIEHEGDEPKSSTYAFEEQKFERVMAGIEYENTKSLIIHTRIGMEPLFICRGDTKATYLAYPPLDYGLVQQIFPEEVLKRLNTDPNDLSTLKSILQEVVSSDPECRAGGLAKLKEL